MSFVSFVVNPNYPVITDPARPAWHFGPPAQWMNDPNGVSWHEGWCHVFYQHNPGGDAWADMHWGHARSRDFVHWEHLPLALRPQLTAGEKHCYSGCLARTAAGEPVILYTSVPPQEIEHGKNTQALATPDNADWRTWTQHVSTPFLDLATQDGPAFRRDWRDPFVFQAEGRTFLVIGAILGEETVVALYENPAGDLRHWVYRGIIHREPRTQTPFLECPNLIPFGSGNKWVLLTSPCRAVEWFSGTLDLHHYTFHIERRGRLDESDHYYATHPATDPTGRIVVFGWVRNFPKNRGWNGCLGVPRRLWLDAAGDLCSEPVTEIATLRTTQADYAPQPLSAAPIALPLPAEAMSDGELTLELAPAAQVVFEIAGVRIAFSADGVRFDDRPTVALAPGRIRVRWLLDCSLLELFVNDRAAYTRVVSFPAAPVAQLHATAGTAQLSGGRVWTLRSAPSTFA
ncbi:MAG: glycoside hydrolase family 32 protein [Opitutaceae bacterium]|nr:glycoside hydrolase family 32 protein [Opitutaceae bacterium]MBP9914033.1 glycoside hydrolase family 32 protein [Opitutaceae bacterium]